MYAQAPNIAQELISWSFHLRGLFIQLKKIFSCWIELLYFFSFYTFAFFLGKTSWKWRKIVFVVNLLLQELLSFWGEFFQQTFFACNKTRTLCKCLVYRYYNSKLRLVLFSDCNHSLAYFFHWPCSLAIWGNNFPCRAPGASLLASCHHQGLSKLGFQGEFSHTWVKITQNVSYSFLI